MPPNMSLAGRGQRGLMNLPPCARTYCTSTVLPFPHSQEQALPGVVTTPSPVVKQASPDSLQACGHFTGVPCTGNICQRLTSSVTPSPTACTQGHVCSHLRLLSTLSPRPFHTYGLFPWCDLAASSEEQQLFFPLQQAITISCMAQGAHDPPQPAASTSFLPGAN